ncbi:MAG: hypothetical protein ACK4ZS_03410, partial [Sulfurimicrobium sp.]
VQDQYFSARCGHPATRRCVFHRAQVCRKWVQIVQLLYLYNDNLLADGQRYDGAIALNQAGRPCFRVLALI